MRTLIAQLRQYSRSRQTGDTMVEVLIVIAVVSLILGGAYVTTNRSLQATRAAQERGNALKIAESQIEQIKGLAATDPDALFGQAPPFCISPVDGKPIAVSHSSTPCTVNISGNPPASGEPTFRLEITKNGLNEFILTERWDDVSGRQTNQLVLRYRVYD